MPKVEVIKVSDLSFSYTQEKEALNGVSFSIYEGEKVSILGHNGSGKSTLAKILVGLNEKFSGKVELFGEELNQNNAAKLRSRIGIVFQNPDNQFVGSTVEDDIAFGLENRCVEREKMHSIIEEYANLVDMKDFLSKEPSTLSGGQKQRVAIAGVLAMRPDLVIFDEATSMLDPKGKKEIYSLISKLKSENPKLTILSITHDVDDASESDRLIVLNNGKVKYDGKPDEIFKNVNELEKIKLVSPFFYRMVDRLKKNGIAVPDNVKNIEQLGEFLCK